MPIGGALAWRFYRQHQFASALNSNSPDAINESRYVTIGGVPQWITIRGENRANPVLLFVHGGPGEAQSGLPMVYRNWERDFTIVQWDQRGAGMSYTAGGRLTPDVTLDRLINDGIEVAQYIRGELNVGPVALVGHSWGSYLAVHMVKANPELFSAYVGTGQLVDLAENIKVTYISTLARARAAHDAGSIKKMESTGRVDYSTRNRYLASSDVSFMQEESIDLLTSPVVSLAQAFDWARGLLQGASPALLNDDLRTLGCNFPIPFFIVQGKDDRITDTGLAKTYFDCVESPHKEIVLIPGGHFAYATEAFRDALVTRLRPVVVGVPN